MKIPTPGYDTETVRKLIETATARATTSQDVRNLCREGGLLHDAQVRPGYFNQKRTVRAVKAMLRRRLAAQLGRTSPRLLDPTHDLECNSCHGIAVLWQGKWLCENGHGGVYYAKDIDSDRTR